jgi:hypothetical protein
MTHATCSLRRRLKPGTPVAHLVYGPGQVISEWKPIVVADCGGHAATTCKGIYDCAFGRAPHLFVHCCRAEYLQKIQ